MKAISLWQPWATLIALGEKHIETRSWSKSYRGPIAIHAAQRWAPDQREILDEEPFKSRLAYHGITADKAVQANLPRGAIIAVANLDAIHSTNSEPNWPFRLTDLEREFGNYGPGRWAWMLSGVHRLVVPVPCRGFQQIFEVEPRAERDVLMAINGAPAAV